jgi:hypothetical protein
MKFFGFGNWQPSKRIYTFYRIFGAVFLIIGIILGVMMFFQTPSPTSPVGLWVIEKIEGINNATDYAGNPMYAEFTKDGKYCSDFETGTTKCTKYDKYYQINDVLVINQKDENGKDLGTFYYIWNIADGKLEISTYFFDENNAGFGNWLPTTKDILKPVLQK